MVAVESGVVMISDGEREFYFDFPLEYFDIVFEFVSGFLRFCKRDRDFIFKRHGGGVGGEGI